MKKFMLLCMVLCLISCQDKSVKPKDIRLKNLVPKEYVFISSSIENSPKQYNHVENNQVGITGSEDQSFVKDGIGDSIALNFKAQFDEIKIIGSKENYFKITGDTNIVKNISYINEKKILTFDFKENVNATNHPLVLEIYSTQINYIDNSSNNTIFFFNSGENGNINIENKGMLKVKLNNASFKDFMVTNLGSIDVSGSGHSENLFITDLNMGKYSLDNFVSKNMNIKTRGMSSGILNVSHLAMGEVSMISQFKIIGHTEIKKVNAILGGHIEYQ